MGPSQLSTLGIALALAGPARADDLNNMLQQTRQLDRQIERMQPSFAVPTYTVPRLEYTPRTSAVPQRVAPPEVTLRQPTPAELERGPVMRSRSMDDLEHLQYRMMELRKRAFLLSAMDSFNALIGFASVYNAQVVHLVERRTAGMDQPAEMPDYWVDYENVRRDVDGLRQQLGLRTLAQVWQDQFAAAAAAASGTPANSNYSVSGGQGSQTLRAQGVDLNGAAQRVRAAEGKGLRSLR